MKKLIYLLLLLSTISYSQQRLEYFTVSANIDPGASQKEGGLDLVAEIEYVGVIYAKMGFETFSALHGGYTDVHGAVGSNKIFGMWNTERLYLGVRMGNVYRGHEGAFRLNTGLEGGYQHTFGDHLIIGLRSTLDKRHDQEIFGWTPQLKLSGFVTIGYRWDYNPNRR